MIGQLNLLNETAGKSQNIRINRAGVEIYRLNSIQHCAFSGWYAQGCPILGEWTVNSTASQSYTVQGWHNTGTMYLNYPYNGLGNPGSEIIFIEVKP
jgi:hypothetical protein